MARLLAVLLTALFAAGCVAMTEAQGERGQLVAEYVRQFKEIDTKGQGLITFEQAKEHYTRRFAELDTGAKGYLSAADLAPLLPVLGAKTGEDLLQRLDNNSDGKVSQSELLIIANWLFQRAFKPDGTLTLADVSRPIPRERWLDPEQPDVSAARMPRQKRAGVAN